MRRSFLPLLFLLFYNMCTAQYARFRHLMVDDGLSQNSAFTFAQDSLGFMWIGTAEGLSRYDGLEFKIYKHDPADSNSLSANSIKGLLVRKHFLWVATYGGGLDRLDLLSGNFKHFVHDKKNSNSISDDVINCIKEIEGKFYIGTVEGGVNIFDPEKESFTSLTVIPGSNIRDICEDKLGNIWFATSGSGLTMYDPRTKKIKNYRADGTKNGINSDRVRTVYADSRGWIWVSCWSSGCCVIEPSTGNIYDNRIGSKSFVARDIPYGLVSTFLEDSKKNIWMCTAESGAVMYNPETGEKKVFMNDANDVHSISDNTVFSIYEDKSKIIWLGTWRGGVNIFDPKTYRFGWYRKDAADSTSLSNNTVYAMKLARSGYVWIGTAQGVCCFDPKTKKFNTLRPDQNSKETLRNNSTVYAIEEDMDSSLWFATSGGGLYHYFPSENKFVHFNNMVASHYMVSSSPSVMCLGTDNTLYVGTYGYGLLVYDREKEEFIDYLNDTANVNSISGNMVGSIENATNGKLWVGTADGGLNLFDPVKKTFKRFISDPKDENTIIENGVSNLCVDHHKKLWVGTSSGLCRYDPETDHFTPYSKMHEFLKQEIVSITEDEGGSLWVTTRKGLARFNATDNTLRTYDVGDGLQSNEFLFKAAVYSPDGKIYLGGFNGFNCFSPSEIKENTSVPEAVITGFTVLNKKYTLPNDISFTHAITLSYRDYFFSFRFSALEFTDPKKNSFKYKLEGFNTDWVEISKSNSVTFTNLDPGEYVFKLKAANNNGVWNETPTEIRITITPPFWRTKWFYALCIAALVLSIYSYIKWREKKLVEEKLVLENKVEKRTEELRHEKEKVEAAHKDIRDSINYAKKIQTAILPQDSQFAQLLPESFILFKPKDIVSGDFYWISENNGAVFYVTADCTGHGVPGGFMTMLGTSLLNEIVNEKNVTEPSKILDLLREKIISSLKQSSTVGESKDGMDMVLVRIDRSKKILTYAAANNSIYIIRKNELHEYKPDKQPIGFYSEETRPFTQHEIALEEDDVIYAFTDGYADQFGGDKGKKFKYKQLEELLVSIHHNTMHEQKSILDATIENWKDGFEQLDDILGIGVKI